MDNAASRLLAILEAGIKQPADVNCAGTWQKLLGASGNVDLLARLGDFLSLVGSAHESVIETHPDEKEAADYWQSRIVNGFYQSSLGHPWKTFSQQIDNVVIFSLRSHAKILNADKPSKKVSQEEISEIRSLLQTALDGVDSLDVPIDIKKLLVFRIDQLISLLNRYHICGQQALLDGGKLLLAEISLLPEDARDTVKKSSAFENVKEGLSTLANAVTVSSAFPQLIAAGANLMKALT